MLAPRYFPIGEAIGLGDLAEGGTRTEHVVVGDPGAAIGSEALDDATQQRRPFVPGKVNIDVGRIGSGHGQKALEVQVVGDGIDVGYTQGIGYDRCGTGATATGAAGHRDDVIHHEEVWREALAADDAKLVVDAPDDAVGQLAVAPLGPVDHAGAQYLGRVGTAIFRKDEAVEDRIEGTQGGDIRCRGQCLRPEGEPPLEIGRRKEEAAIGRPRLDIACGKVADGLAEGDRAEHLVRGAVFRIKEGRVVKGDERHAEAAGRSYGSHGRGRDRGVQ